MGCLLPTYASHRYRRVAAAALLALVIACAAPASAIANRLYVNFGDSVGNGAGASSGHSYFDLYCAYLESSSIVDQCVNEAAGGETSQSALADGMVRNVINDIRASTDTPVITVSLGGNDVLRESGCQPVIGFGCPFIHSMRTILNELEAALATRSGNHTIKWLEYYNPNHDNPFGDASSDQRSAALLLGNDLAYTDCTSYNLNLIGLNDVIRCIAKEKGATAVDAYMPFQAGCTSNDCFSDRLHPDDKGYGLIFDAFRDAPGRLVPATSAPDGTWPYLPRPIVSDLSETRHRFALSTARHKRGTVFSFKLDQPATLTIDIEHEALGRRVGHACVFPLKRLRHRPRCTREALVGALVRQELPGLDTIAFSGRIRGHALKRGRYDAVFVATSTIRASAPRSLQFTVI